MFDNSDRKRYDNDLKIAFLSESEWSEASQKLPKDPVKYQRVSSSFAQRQFKERFEVISSVEWYPNVIIIKHNFKWVLDGNAPPTSIKMQSRSWNEAGWISFVLNKQFGWGARWKLLSSRL